MSLLATGRYYTEVLVTSTQCIQQAERAPEKAAEGFFYPPRKTEKKIKDF